MMQMPSSAALCDQLADPRRVEDRFAYAICTAERAVSPPQLDLFHDLRIRQ
jgi:hypothetical protein